MPRGPSGSSRAGSIITALAYQSLHPSPICSLPDRQLTVGPPVRRLDTPWVYSWTMMPFSRSPSRIAGRAVLRCTEPVAGSPALTVFPSSWVTMTAGMPTGMGSMSPLITLGFPATLLATITATAPAASALSTCWRNEHSGGSGGAGGGGGGGAAARSTSAMEPAGRLKGSHPSFTFPRGGGARPSSTRTMFPEVPAPVGAGVNLAYSAW
jgi:hypothetical protein